jgi:hypothetical protein
MCKSTSMNRGIAIILASVFLFSFLTVEIYQSSGYPWLRYPGFLESNAEVAVAEMPSAIVELCGAAEYYSLSYRAPHLGQTTLFLHIYRGPPTRAV